ncbi:HmuY family protein [Bizionia psychrotolerans]|uniref:HmuY family protein n=1 Tax=Bizionia psychrotolerans TaxID=1492901 RepID=UPI0006503FCB|nr:HmuY family protein [Bizionia psychrotolerans]
MINKFLSALFTIALLATFGCSSDDDNSTSGPISVVIEGASFAPEIGGPNQQNQVYIDLSTNTATGVQRDSWDLGFYSGPDFRVAINGSIYMATAELTASDIDAVSSTSTEVQTLQTQVAVGTFDDVSAGFIDAPYGNIDGTAIDAVSEDVISNHVYLVNLGFEVGTGTPANGSVEVAGNSRGWKKIRVYKSGHDYVLQYADLDATTHNTVTISKNADYNFTFFSFDTDSEVYVEPIKEDWDLNFTVFTNEIPGYGAYGYSDFIVNNTKSDATAYMIDTDVDTELSYENFTLANVVDTNFSNDQRAIGSSWRNGGGPGTLPSLKENVFYIVNDTEGNLYKLQFLALTNADGERGHPEFVYSLLQ